MDNTFEEFLNRWFMEREYHGSDGDSEGVEAFEHWLSEMEQEELIKLAHLAIREGELRGLQRGADIALRAIKDISYAI